MRGRGRVAPVHPVRDSPPALAKETILKTIAASRDGLFAEFTGMLDTMSPENIGERLRSLL